MNVLPQYAKFASEFTVGQIFAETNGVFSVVELPSGEILEIKPTGLVLDDGARDEIFLAFVTIQKARAVTRNEYWEAVNYPVE